MTTSIGSVLNVEWVCMSAKTANTIEAIVNNLVYIPIDINAHIIDNRP